jgi:ribosomal protein L11 methyltransferase
VLKKKGINPFTIIDVGCGTGILSIAMAKLFSSRIIAVDNDIHSVQMTQRNIVLNKVVQYVKVYNSTGLIGNHLNSRAKYDLIVANILFKPIKILMRTFIANLSKGGFLILSGLNIKQARQLKEISKQFGLKVIDERKESNWGSLLLKRIDGKRAIKQSY